MLVAVLRAWEPQCAPLLTSSPSLSTTSSMMKFQISTTLIMLFQVKTSKVRRSAWTGVVPCLAVFAHERRRLKVLANAGPKISAQAAIKMRKKDGS